MTVPCTGLVPQSCLRIKKGNDFATSEWELLYGNIEGFEFQVGYFYQLEVRETKLPPELVPADASSIKYTLVKMIDKRQDTKTRLHDIWALEAINGEVIDFSDAGISGQHPTLEINLTKMYVLGMDGCNEFSARITSLTDKELLLELGPNTLMACHNMVIPSRVNLAVKEVVGYELNGLKLSLKNEAGREVLRYKKVD